MFSPDLSDTSVSFIVLPSYHKYDRRYVLDLGWFYSIVCGFQTPNVTLFSNSAQNNLSHCHHDNSMFD